MEDIEIENLLGFSFELKNVTFFQMKNIKGMNLQEYFIKVDGVKETDIDTLLLEEGNSSSCFIETEGTSTQPEVTYSLTNIQLHQYSFYSLICSQS